MQLVLSRNWTRVAVSISCDDNHYTTVKKVMLIVFWDMKGLISISFLEKDVISYCQHLKQNLFYLWNYTQENRYAIRELFQQFIQYVWAVCSKNILLCYST